MKITLTTTVYWWYFIIILVDLLTNVVCVCENGIKKNNQSIKYLIKFLIKHCLYNVFIYLLLNRYTSLTNTWDCERRVVVVVVFSNIYLKHTFVKQV